MRLLPTIGALAGVAAFVMIVTALVARRLRNNGIVDVVWALGFLPLLGVLHALVWHDRTPGSGPTAGFLVISALGAAWSGRLGLHLLARFRRHHPLEDVRYAELRREWGTACDARMFWFFQLQGASQVLLSLPFVLAALAAASPQGSPAGPWTWIGGILAVVSVLGESVADRQLAAFKASNPPAGTVCRRGLWRWSRHPNYFFEWLTWVGIAIVAVPYPAGGAALLAPAVMYVLLVHVTGIPMTESLAVRSRGDAYRNYQATTSRFFPWASRPASHDRSSPPTPATQSRPGSPSPAQRSP